MVRLLAISVFIVTTLSACNLFHPKSVKKEEAVARVFDKYLYKNDLKGVVPHGINNTDSMEITTAYINNWIRQELLLKQAEDNLEQTKRDFTKQIEQYRNSLIIYAYEAELVKQKLDTVVPAKEIEDYYNKNQSNFQLRENIVLASYVILRKKSGIVNKIKSLLLSNKENDKEKLQTYCQENGAEYMISNGTWMSFTDLTRKIPLTVDDQQDFLSKNKYIEVNDSTASYFVAISAFKTKESISPLTFETENIRTILLNKRKAELIAHMENDLIGDAVKRNNYEIFKK